MTSAARPATLVYNAGGGSSHRAPLEAVMAALQDAGYDARLLPTHSADDVPRVLTGVTGPVFVAGGDGTFRGAALALAGRPDVTLGVIPLGTSNNIAGTLGLRGAPLDIVRSYAGAQGTPFDAGRVTAPWGTDLFFEACGCGVFADILHAYDPDAPGANWSDAPLDDGAVMEDPWGRQQADPWAQPNDGGSSSGGGWGWGGGDSGGGGDTSDWF